MTNVRTRYLLDTNVVSELRRVKPHGAVATWITNTSLEEVMLPAVAIGEIQVGIERTRSGDPVKADEIEEWLEAIIATFAIVPMEETAFRLWARLMHRKPQHLYLDTMIAATAIVNGLTVVTRNVRDFQQFGVPILNPFENA